MSDDRPMSGDEHQKGAALGREEQDTVPRTQDEVRSLKKDLRIYHSELLSQNEALLRVNQALSDVNYELRRSEQRYASLFEDAPVAYFVFDTEGRILSANHAFCTLLDRREGELVGCKLSRFLAARSQDAYYFFVRNLDREFGGQRREEFYFQRGDQQVPTQLHFNCYLEGGAPRIRGTAFDLTEIRRLTERLSQEAERYHLIAEQSNEILFEYLVEEDKALFSPRVQERMGGALELDRLSMRIVRDELVHPEDQPGVRVLFDKVWDKHKSLRCTLRLRGMPEQEYSWYELVGTVLFAEDRPVRVVGALSDVDKQVREREALVRAAQTDLLTKVLNKQTVQTRIESFLLGEGRMGSHALLVVDIDNFRAINDRMGHLAGDAVLAEAARKLERATRPGDLMGRIGGDEFMVLLSDRTAQEAEAVAAQICSILGTVLCGTQEDGVVAGSVGMSFFPGDGMTFLDLFRKADLALYYAKHQGKNGYRRYGDVPMKVTVGQGLLNEYQAVDPYEERRYANMLLVTNIMELLFVGKDAESAIRLVVSMLGSYYQVSHVCIMELQPGQTDCRMTYEWYMDQDDRRMEPLRVLSKEAVERYSTLFTDEGLFCCYDVDVMSGVEREIWEKCTGVGLRTSLQCAFLDEGQFRGFVALDDFSPSRTWSQEDINSLMLIGKSLGVYLTKYRAQQRSERYASMDLLVDLWNFNKFTQEGAAVLAGAWSGFYAVVSLDVCGLHFFNDHYGYAEGDAILCALGQTLKNSLQAGEMAARVGGDQFGLLLAYTRREDLQGRLAELLVGLNCLTLKSGHSHRVTISSGVYLVPDQSVALTTCMDRANLARKRAKEGAGHGVIYYDQELELAVMQEKFIEEHMAAALRAEEFFVLYQPKVSFATGQVTGAEALVRWHSSHRGVLYPDTFIPVLEKSGFVVELDFYVLDRVCRKLSQWRAHDPDLVMAVNFSRLHVGCSDSVSRAVTILRRWGVAPQQVEVEITERAFLADVEPLSDYVARLHEAGFRVAMDDFGAGYSSLSLLKDLPVDVLKLDRAFLRKEITQRERVVIGSVVDMAHQLGMTIVAEGVETVHQVELLQGISCELAQGYYFAAPMEEADFEAVLSSGGVLTLPDLDRTGREPCTTH